MGSNHLRFGHWGPFQVDSNRTRFSLEAVFLWRSGSEKPFFWRKPCDTVPAFATIWKHCFSNSASCWMPLPLRPLLLCFCWGSRQATPKYAKAAYWFFWIKFTWKTTGSKKDSLNFVILRGISKIGGEMIGDLKTKQSFDLLFCCFNVFLITIFKIQLT